MCETIFRKIKGLNGYEISRCGVLKSLKYTPHRTLKLSKRNTYSMFDNGRMRTIHVGRLIYAAFNDLDIDKLGDIHVIGTRLDELQVFTPKEYLDYIRSMRKSRKLSLSEVVADYKERIRFSNIVLRFIETGDTTELCTAVYSHKEELYQYALKQRFSCNDDTLNEAVAWVLNECIIRLTSLEISHSNMRPYMRKIIRAYFSRERKYKKVCYRDNVYYGVNTYE